MRVGVRQASLVLALCFPCIIRSARAAAPLLARAAANRGLSTARLPRMESVRITTYNVLSNKLAGADHFRHCDPKHLDAEYRFRRLLEKLTAEVEQGAVICLQEVSKEWAGRLTVFFAQHNYTFATGLYGRYFNGYMGVGTAWPNDKYELLAAEIKKLSDTVRFAAPPPPSVFQRAFDASMDFVPPVVQRALDYLGLKPRRVPDEFEEANRRQNEIVIARLRHRGQEGKGFWVANYHMPCMFQQPRVMTIHATMAVQYLQQLAKNDPHVLTGDFNLTPTSSMYKLLTTGEMDENDPAMPRYRAGERWSIALKEPLRSAYKEAFGAEPDFTNYARVRDDPPFIDTLDYIFVSKHWRIHEALPLPHRNDVQGPFPNAEECSDHVLVSATLALADNVPI